MRLTLVTVPRDGKQTSKEEVNFDVSLNACVIVCVCMCVCVRACVRACVSARTRSPLTSLHPDTLSTSSQRRELFICVSFLLKCSKLPSSPVSQ